MIQANSLNIPLKDESVQCIVTSPPYWSLRDYSVGGQLGLEATPEEFVENCVTWAREVWRVLRKDGTFWLNLGDTYVSSPTGNMENSYQFRNSKTYNRSNGTGKVDGLKPKDLCGMPWKVAFALQADGWWLRSAMPWVKRSAMPESCTDRPASALEYVFLFTKSSKYYFDMDAIRKHMGNEMSWGEYQALKSSKTWDGDSLPGGGNGNPGYTSGKSHPNGRNFRNTDLFYQSLEEPHGAIFCGEEMVGLDVNPYSYKEAHFATFPPKLVEPCIKAGTSEKGACPECGAPWERIIEKEKAPRRSVDSRAAIEPYENAQGNFATERWDEPDKSKTIGWLPTCSHKAEPVPCVVLDPFAGSFTTKSVAQRLGRVGIGLELKWEYIQMGKKRCYQEPSLF